jgi:hypothetical protein
MSTFDWVSLDADSTQAIENPMYKFKAPSWGFVILCHLLPLTSSSFADVSASFSVRRFFDCWMNMPMERISLSFSSIETKTSARSVKRMPST